MKKDGEGACRACGAGNGFPRQCEHWLGMTVLTGAAAWDGECPGTAVEGKAAAVARGSGSEAVAESCGGTVLLTDSGTRKNRLREKHRTSLRQGVARRGSLET